MTCGRVENVVYGAGCAGEMDDVEKLTCAICKGDGCEHCGGAGYYESKSVSDCVHDLYAKNKALEARAAALENKLITTNRRASGIESSLDRLIDIVGLQINQGDTNEDQNWQGIEAVEADAQDGKRAE